MQLHTDQTIICACHLLGQRQQLRVARRLGQLVQRGIARRLAILQDHQRLPRHLPRHISLIMHCKLSRKYRLQRN